MKKIKYQNLITGCMEEVKIDPGLKNYIFSTRKTGFSDSKIKEGLTNAGWPLENVEAAFRDCDAVPDLLKVPMQKFEAKEPDKKKDENKKDELFTKPALLETPNEEIKKEEPKKEKKSFSLLAIVALLVSPIPFIGLGVAMAAIESISKHKHSGMIFAILALFINMAVIGFIMFILYQIFTLNPDQLTGFSRYIVDTFGLVE